jgi:hypothetical protein
LKSSGRSGYVRPPLPPTYHPQPSSSTSNKKSPVVSPVSHKSAVSTPVPASAHPQYSSLSPLTPETGFHDLLRKIEDEEIAENEDDENDDQDEDGGEFTNEEGGYEDDMSLSQSSHANSSNLQSHDNSNNTSERKQPSGRGGFFKQTANSTSSTLTSDNTLPLLPNRQTAQLQDYGPLKNINHLRVMQLAHDDPEVLVGWKIFVPSYGNGQIIATKKKKFHTTRYLIQFENYSKLIDLPLQRSKTKGTVAFTLIGKMK